VQQQRYRRRTGQRGPKLADLALALRDTLEELGAAECPAHARRGGLELRCVRPPGHRGVHVSRRGVAFA